VADGSPSELKSRIGGDRIEVKVTDPGEVVAAAGVIVQYATGEPSIDGEHRTVTAPVPNDFRLVDVVRALDEAGIDVADVNRREATLDDVFLGLTSPLATSPPSSASASSSDSVASEGKHS
jgi:ABC-2 type transport system ATP-binding protein